jgi:DNA-directed RNA polymerase subunit RPC12/RpoP
MASLGYVVIAIAFGVAGGIVGRIKGSSFLLWFLISGAVPIFGLMAAIAYRSERNELRRKCPRCGKVVKIYDAMCMRCGAELELPEVAVMSESMEQRQRGGVSA